MTGVASSERGAWVTRVSLTVGILATGILAVLVVRADADAPRHSLWRDAVSWFAADEAPDPTWTRAALVAIGASFLLLAAGGWMSHRPRLAVFLTAIAGGLVVVIGLVPIECSMRIDFCEQLVRNRLVGGGHLVHAIAAVALFALCSAAAAVVAVRSRLLGRGLVALATIAATAAIIAVPAGGRVGPLQWVVVAGAAISFPALWQGSGDDQRSAAADMPSS